MVARALVESDIDLGARLLDALDEAHIPIEVAYWFLSEEWGFWWLVLGTPLLTDQDSLPLRVRINEILRTLDGHEFAMDKLGIVGMDDYWVRAIRERLPNGSREGGHWLGGFWSRDTNLSVEDSYVYRLAPQPKGRAHGAAPKRRAGHNGLPPSRPARATTASQQAPGGVPG